MKPWNNRVQGVGGWWDVGQGKWAGGETTNSKKTKQTDRL